MPNAMNSNASDDRFLDGRAVDHKPPHIGHPEDYVRALAMIDLSSCERDMLRAHATAPGREITGLELARAAGHFGARIGNRKYGRLARKLSEAAGLPMCDSDVSDYLAAIFTLADGHQSDNEDWCWIMHDNVVKALSQARII